MFNFSEFKQTGEDLYAAGLNNTHSGNLSVKNYKTMFITRTGSMLHRLNHTDIIETIINGQDEQTKLASREIPVHRSIYLNTDAQAIVHAHPPNLITLSNILDNIKPFDAEGAYYFKNGVAVLTVADAIASNEVANKIFTLFNVAPIVIIKNHGSFAIGKTLEEALHWTSSLEHSAKMLILRNKLNSNFS